MSSSLTACFVFIDSPGFSSQNLRTEKWLVLKLGKNRILKQPLSLFEAGFWCEGEPSKRVKTQSSTRNHLLEYVATRRKKITKSTPYDSIRIRVSKKLKEEASDILSSMGLNFSDLMRMTLIRLVAERQIPFSTEIPNKTTREAMAAADRGEVTYYDSVTDFFKNRKS